MKTLGLVSLGCAKNADDLQLRAGRMLKRGYVLAADPDSCDTLVVNTCAFIASAREEAEAEIGRALALKADGRVKRVVVAGCYPERYPERKRDFPGVDVWEGVPKRFERQCIPGFRFTGKAFAYLKIAEGCAHKCAYCAIPAIRGKYRSRPAADVVAEARTLIETGVRELNVIAQDPMLWGVDLKGGRRLTDLLWKIDALPGDFRIRVLYSYPSEITDAFLDWLRTSVHACRYVDVPLQHTDPAILAAMKRGSAAEASLVAAERIRAAVPGVTLRTTLMTGFPGETATSFGRLLNSVRQMKFDHLGAFAFSPEAGTAAARLPGRPSARIAEKRRERLMALQETIWREAHARKIGEVREALVVAPGIARMESQAPDVDGVVKLRRGGKNAPVGEFVKVKIVASDDYDFVGDVMKERN